MTCRRLGWRRAVAGLKEAVQRLHLDGRGMTPRSLASWNPAWQSTRWPGYATYYAGRSFCGSSGTNEALAALTPLANDGGQDYLAEGAALAPPPKPPARSDSTAVALRLYEQLAARKTLAADEVL